MWRRQLPGLGPRQQLDGEFLAPQPTCVPFRREEILRRGEGLGAHLAVTCADLMGLGLDQALLPPSSRPPSLPSLSSLFPSHSFPSPPPWFLFIPSCPSLPLSSVSASSPRSLSVLHLAGLLPPRLLAPCLGSRERELEGGAEPPCPSGLSSRPQACLPPSGSWERDISPFPCVKWMLSHSNLWRKS